MVPPPPPFSPPDYLRAYALLLRVERLNAMSSLGSGVAHDLKNLIGVVKNYALLMQQDLKDGHPVAPDDIEAILEASGQAVELSQALMTFGRKDEDPEQAFDLAERVEKAWLVLAPVIPPQISIGIQFEGGPFPLRGDPRRVDQILVTLGINAAEAMPAGGRLEIRIHGESGEGDRPWVRWDMEDTGLGMPPEVIGQVFQPFFTTKPESGSGLGLAAVKAVVRHFRGRVDVASTEGKGTRVTVRMPLERRASARPGDERSE